jgi:hypothetical protein
MRTESWLFVLLSSAAGWTQGQDLGQNADAAPSTSSEADVLADAAATLLATDAGGSNTLSGALAFPVGFSLMDPREAADECHANVLPDGSFDAISVLLASGGVSGSFCGSSVPTVDATGIVVDVEIAALGYGSQPSNPVALAPGLFPIGNEGVPDDDLCMLEVNPGALLDVRAFDQDGGGATTLAQGLSGTVTVTSVSQTGIAGSFSATMIDLDPVSGAPLPGTESSLTGTFDTTLCPGVTQ